MKATNLGIWYVQLPLQFVVSDVGEVIEPKEHNGSRFVWIKRVRVPVSRLPKLNYSQAMDFKKVFWD